MGASVNELLGNVCVSPKAGVVHGRVPVLVHEVHVGLVAEQQLYNLLVSMGRGKMQRCVVAHIGCVNSCPATDQHLHDLGVSSLGRPVQWRELMIIPLVHVMICVVEPHPHLDGVALHLVLLVLLVLLDLAPVALVEVGDVQVLRRRQVLPAAPPHPTALRPTHYFPLTSPKSPNCSST